MEGDYLLDSGELYLYMSEQEGYDLVRVDGLPDTAEWLSDELGVAFQVNGDVAVSVYFAYDAELWLQDLGIEGVTISPTLQNNILNYTATVGYDVSSVTITASAFFWLSPTIDGLGEKELKVGENTFIVTLTIPVSMQLESGTQEYKITITRQAQSGSGIEDTTDSETEDTTGSGIEDKEETTTQQPTAGSSP